MMNLSLVELEAWNDCLLLLNSSAQVCAAFKEAVGRERHFAQMARAVRDDGLRERELLEWCRSCRDDGDAANTEDDRLHAKLALAIGLAGLRGMEAAGLSSAADERGARRDAFLYRLYHIVGDGPGPQAESVHALFKALLQRSTIELHTFVADRDNVEHWIGEMGAWERKLAAELPLFAQAAAERFDPSMLDAIGADAPFYSAADPLLPVLLRLRRGEAVAQADVQAAVDAEPASEYGRLVRGGFRACLTASDYFAN